MSSERMDVPADDLPENQLDRFLDDGKLDREEIDELADGLAEYDVLPPEERAEHRRVFLQRLVTEATVGPIPPPSMLAGYEDILPGAADRIFAMAENQQVHRHELENKAMKANTEAEKRGTYAGAFIATLVILCSTVLIAMGKSAEGLSMVLPSLGVLVGLFLHEQAVGKKELSEKQEQADSNELSEAQRKELPEKHKQGDGDGSSRSE